MLGKSSTKMKTYSKLLNILAGVSFAVLTCSTNNSRAASAQILLGQPSHPYLFQNVRWAEEKVEKLRHAYYLLDHADGDYGGHRVAAMHSIKKAAELLGVEIKGGGHAEESQWASDRKLREAKRLMEELLDKTGGKEQQHVRRAIKELDKALITK